MKKYKAKISKIILGEGIEKYTVLVYDKNFSKWITCGTVDKNGVESIVVFDEDYEADAFIEESNLELVSDEDLKCLETDKSKNCSLKIIK